MSFEEKVVPLEGITILDLSTVLSGPASTMLLADQGARVIKVESSDGDLTRQMGIRKGSLSTAFININRGKQSLSVDLKTSQGRQIIEELAKNCDVFVQNFRPGVIERLGLGEETIRKLNNQIVYVSISGFGDTGPLKNIRVYDPVIQAISGLTDIQAGDTSRPKMVRTVIPDKVTALKAAQAITAGLLYGSRVAKGCHIKLSMLDAMVAFLWPEGMMNYTLIKHEVSESPEGQIAQDLVFNTLDGFITVGAMSDREWASLCEVLQKPEWVSDPRFKTTTLRLKNAKIRLRMTSEILKMRESCYWLARFKEKEVPCAPILSRNEMLIYDQVLQSKIYTELNHPNFGRIRQPRSAAIFDGSAPTKQRYAPTLGQHNEEITRELGYTKADIDSLYDKNILFSSV